MGAALLAVMVFVIAPGEASIGARLAARAADPLWRPIALAIEASILEELAFRLLIVSAVTWLFAAGWRKSSASLTAIVLGVAAGSLAFGLAHVPSWLEAVGSPSLALVLTIVGLNGLAGLVFGAIYWRLGIEAAILSHFAADIVVQIIGPRLF